MGFEDIMPDLDQFKEKYHAKALIKHEKALFNDIVMEQIRARDIEKLLGGELSVKYDNIAKFPCKGTVTGNLHEMRAIIDHFKNSENIRIYLSKDIPDYYVLCWGKFGNEDVYTFNEYFEIKPEFKGWKAGAQYSI
jgi:hypothetical protein